MTIFFKTNEVRKGIPVVDTPERKQENDQRLQMTCSFPTSSKRIRENHEESKIVSQMLYIAISTYMYTHIYVYTHTYVDTHTHIAVLYSTYNQLENVILKVTFSIDTKPMFYLDINWMSNMEDL